MAVVRGVKERVHLPIYDAITVEPEQQLREVVNSGNQLRFFVDVQDKTKLQTNLQSASLLPHYNTFEARAMRVVISDLPPQIVDDDETIVKEECPVVLRDDEGDWGIAIVGGNLEFEDEDGGNYDANEQVYADITVTLTRLIDAIKEARESDDGDAEFDIKDDDVELFRTADSANPGVLSDQECEDIVDEGGSVYVPLSELLLMVGDFPNRIQPPIEQVDRNNGAGTVIGKVIYNTVTSLFVGEKTMIQMPTWFFPAGAGPYSDTVDLTTHGQPSPMATFRFAEPIFIDKQQNFRVEIEMPDADTADQIKRLYGPLHLWVVLDGYMTRDVQ